MSRDEVSDAMVMKALIEQARLVAAKQRELLDTLDEALDRAEAVNNQDQDQDQEKTG
jgi:hypothetical protein